MEKYITTERGRAEGYESDFTLIEFTGSDTSLEEIFPYLYHICITKYEINWSEEYKEVESIVGYIPVNGDQIKETSFKKGDVCLFFERNRPWWATFTKDSPELAKFLSNYSKVDD